MNATAKLTNNTGVQKNLTQIRRYVKAGETIDGVPLHIALQFINRPGWTVELPPPQD